MFKVPIGREANDGRAVFSAPPDGPGPFLTSAVTVGVWVQAELVHGRRTLSVAVDSTTTGIATLDDLRCSWRDLSLSGMRDWLILHRLVHEQGSTLVTWTPAAHIEGTTYERQARREGRPGVVTSIVRRLRLMAATELAWPTATRRAVPLLTMEPAPGSDCFTLELDARLAAVDPRRRFAWVPETLLVQDPVAVRLGVAVLAGFHHARPLDVLVLREGTLWTWGALRTGAGGRRRWPAARAALVRHLHQLEACGVIGVFEHDRALGPEARFRLTPPAWWTSADAGPLKLPTVALAGTPATGAELRSWRLARGLTQADVARVAGVSQSRVSSVETTDVDLPRGWRRALRADVPPGAHPR